MLINILFYNTERTTENQTTGTTTTDMTTTTTNTIAITTTDAMTTTDDMTTLVSNRTNNTGSSKGNYDY